jgi:hypothetical protein
MGASDPIVLPLDARARELLLRYAYPFEPLRSELELPRRSRRVACDRFDLEHLLGNLAYSINHCEDGSLQEELNELYEELELYERSGDRLL